ncbi:hydratase [Faecalibacterium prausnitzii]|nr:hydratase [Faecalibacterium prausnitzii]MBV0926721.1 hydratase [Faecalibacterium prausnitzii]MCG4793406.1 hydratase [Faecalibacterium prausnitzii]MCG4799213.1 hydratase [Faecalibacterium prausnitzii]MDE8722985.1 hydratase [Faecalibacterium prausnitzii]MEE0243392.1 hydratase [Faecalibacterium prausnitzii]
MLDMIKCSTGGAYYARGEWVPADGNAPAALAAKGFDAAAVAAAKTGTMAYNIMQAHNTSGDAENLKIKFDAMASHDITFVGIIQTARASGLEKFPIPYVLTNCHNSLCAVGGTINEDDHRFGLSAAKKYGGIFVPPHMAVIHQYMRERFAGCGKMILGSDSHTRYGALGTMAIGEGGGELAKQLLGRTYDVARPGVVAIYLTGSLPVGCGPHDVAIALVGKLFKSGYVKNKVMEFVGPGIASLRQDTRNAIDAMTTETTCLSSIWETDEVTQRFLAVHGRAADYKKLTPADLAYYDGVVEVDLSAIRPMIALPMHPSNAFTIEELNANLEDILHACEQDVQKLIGRKDVQLDLCSKIENGKLRVDQGVIAGCAGGLYDSIYEAASILKGHTGGCGDYALSVYPGSQPIMMELVRTGVIGELMASGATIRTAFCGPCFGAGDVPANGALSIRHTTRNFPSREGSKPGSGQLAGVALMDARSIAATTANGGILTPATDIDYDPTVPEYQYDASSYDTRVYQGFGKGDYDALLKFGPNIKDWPEIAPLGDNLLLKVASYITDPVTTTDELIPSGETSSYRSNPLGLAEFTLSRKDPEYVSRAKAVQAEENARRAGAGDAALLAKVNAVPGCEQLSWNDIQIASTIFAVKPGDGSAREQAASCQRVLGAGANIVTEYATKRYRSNLINWGMLPLQLAGATPFGLGDYVLIPNVREVLKGDLQNIKAYVLGDTVKEFELYMAPLTTDERQILADGCLINFYKH